MSRARPAANTTSLASRIERWLSRVWWTATPGFTARALSPLAWVYGALAARAKRRAGSPEPTPVPVIVVGNLVVGGAGKTPVVIALVQALQAAGRRPGVISRGHGRRERDESDATGEPRSRRDIAAVETHASADEVGDEPLLIARRTGVPVFVGRQRAAVARALCQAHPRVDVIVSDDGLQHHALTRQAELIVFDDRGAGNGLLLPAGPLREPLPASLSPGRCVVYSGRAASTRLPGVLAPRSARRAVLLEAWAAESGATTEPASPGHRQPEAAAPAVPLSGLRGRRLTALAGIGAPEQFFAMLEAEGLTIDRLPCADHARYANAPWPEGTAEVVTTEKDAVKLAALPRLGARVWVVPLDCQLPDALVRDVLRRVTPPLQEPLR